VFHVLRCYKKDGAQKTAHLQVAGIVEITNLVDIQGQQRAYLSMEDIEQT
jgi:hypothetical protein